MDPKSAALFVLFGLGLVVFPVLVLRYRRLELRHQERMVAFEKGVPVPIGECGNALHDRDLPASGTHLAGYGSRLERGAVHSDPNGGNAQRNDPALPGEGHEAGRIFEGRDS